jgi:hypothetical protein
MSQQNGPTSCTHAGCELPTYQKRLRRRLEIDAILVSFSSTFPLYLTRRRYANGSEVPEEDVDDLDRMPTRECS